MDFDLPVTPPAPPSTGNPLGLTALKISRATGKLDQVEVFYREVLNAKVLRWIKLAQGGEKLALPDTTTGKSTVQLQFWSRASAETGVEKRRKSGVCDGWTAKSWEEYLYTVAQEAIQSPTRGFPKMLDFHFSHDCVDSDCVLDPIKDRLEAAGHPY